MIEITFGQGYLCCGCGIRFRDRDTAYRYKNSCLCRGCNEKLRRFDGSRMILGEYYGEHTYSPFYYDGLYRDIFVSFKFSGNTAYGHLLGMAVADGIGDIAELRTYDCITAVPLSKERMNTRGFNQSKVIADYISQRLELPYEELLLRVKHCAAQSSSDVVSRAQNVKDAFAAKGGAYGKRIILVDDVHTTGSTLMECTNTLLSAGAAYVCRLTAAYVYHKKRQRLF